MKNEKYDELFSVPCGISFPCKPGSWPSAEEYAEAMKKQSSADSKILQYLIQVYEQHTSSTAAAFQVFWAAVDRLYAEKLLSPDEVEKIRQAAHGDIAATQILVQRNPDIVRLPFVQNTIIAFLKNYKYSLAVDLRTEKDRWNDFLVKRPKKKNMLHKENIRNLYSIIAQTKGKRDTYTSEKVGDLLGISQSHVSKTIAVKGRKGRPKKRK